MKKLGLDQGTNFVGAADELNLDAINVEDSKFDRFLTRNGAVWKSNSSHSSRMGGTWKKMVELTRRIMLNDTVKTRK